MRKRFFLTTILLLTASFFALSQSGPDARILSVAGHSEYAKVVELNGRSYVAVDDVARLTRGSLSFKANRILLSLPNDQTHASASGASPTQGFSKQFLQAAIEQMSALREWRITVVNSIQNNSPISEEWIAELQRRAQKGLALAGAARSTEDDRNCYQLLSGEFANMRKLSDNFLAKRRRLLYIDPHSINNDPLDRQIVACAHSLASMAADNQFREEAACTAYH